MQVGNYKYSYRFKDERELFLVVTGLLFDPLGHTHNFEVWQDENTVHVNKLGSECVERIYATLK